MTISSCSLTRVLVTAPAQPASKARLIISPVVVGGADERIKGFRNLIPQKSTLRSASLEIFIRVLLSLYFCVSLSDASIIWDKSWSNIALGVRIQKSEDRMKRVNSSGFLRLRLGTRAS